MSYGRKSKPQYGRKAKGSKRGPKMPRATQLRIQAELEEDELTKHGYRMRSKESTRHMALGKAVHEDGGLTVHKRLILLYTWNKNKNPKTARLVHQDAEWVKRRYYGTKHWPEPD